MKVKVKKVFEKATIPSYATDGSAGLDFTALNVKYVYEDEKDHYYSLSDLKYIEVGTGIAVEIPSGYVGLIFPRSSITNKDLILGNSVGVIDSDYRGEIKFRFKRTKVLSTEEYKIGEKIGQMIIIPIPAIEMEEVQDLSDTKRSSGGYGSTGG